MYKKIIRPVLFLLKPEAAHAFIVKALKLFFAIPLVKPIVSKIYGYKSPNLNRSVFGLEFDNPVGLAAGFDKDADIYSHLSAFGFSFIEIGTITPKGQPGNPKPRSFRIPKDDALINRMGFNNRGVENAVQNLSKRKNHRVIIGGNIGKNTLTPNSQAHNDYLHCFKEMYNYVDYFVVNVSCPNIEDLRDLQDTEQLGSILKGITEYRALQEQRKPILLKVSPDLTFDQLDESIETARQFNIDGFVATNTTTSREKLSVDAKTIAQIGDGGLSGQPLKDRATEVIRHIHTKTNGEMPIMGVGGIHTVKDAMEKIEAGASLIQIYTGFIYEGPGIARRICKAIDKQMP